MQSRLSFSTLAIVSLGVVLASLSSVAIAQANDIEQYLDDATLAVVVIDLEELSVTEIADLFTDVADGDRISLHAMQSQLRAIATAVGRLQELEVNEVYAAFSLHDFTRKMPYLILPTTSDAQAERVAKFLKYGSSAQTSHPQELGVFRSIFTRDNTVIAGNLDLQTRLDPTRIPSRQTGLREALAVKQSAPIRLISVMTADQRRVITEMLPTLSDELSGLTGEQIANIQWLSLGIDLKQGGMEGILHIDDQDAASKLAKGLPLLLKGIASATLVESTDAGLRNLIASVQAEADGGDIKLATPAVNADQRAEIVTSVVQRIGPSVRDVSVMQNLKQLALGMHNFHDRYLGFPPPASFDADGNPLLSWRVYLLPYLGEDRLYQEFHFDEPWNSEHNRQLIQRMPDVFASEHIDLNRAGKTTMLLPIGEKAGFHGTTGIAIRDIADGTSLTIMMLEAPRDLSVTWTQPEDFSIERKDLKSMLFNSRSKMWTAFFDGSANAIPESLTEETLRYLFTYDGGENVNLSGE